MGFHRGLANTMFFRRFLAVPPPDLPLVALILGSGGARTVKRSCDGVHTFPSPMEYIPQVETVAERLAHLLMEPFVVIAATPAFGDCIVPPTPHATTHTEMRIRI